jgi:hypothetical protein
MRSPAKLQQLAGEWRRDGSGAPRHGSLRAALCIDPGSPRWGYAPPYKRPPVDTMGELLILLLFKHGVCAYRRVHIQSTWWIASAAHASGLAIALRLLTSTSSVWDLRMDPVRVELLDQTAVHVLRVIRRRFSVHASAGVPSEIRAASHSHACSCIYCQPLRT